jgi:hypothetical protein
MATQPDAKHPRMAFTRGKLQVPRLRPLLPAIAAGLAGVVLIGAPQIAAANSDPHRSFAAAGPLDLPASFCGFPVHIGVVANNEYQTVSLAPDGSTLIKVTGRFVDSATNEVSGRTVTVNASGPSTLTVPTEGTILTYVGHGLTLLYAANATSFGLPSDLVVTSGPLDITLDASSQSLITMTGTPHVLEDVCAALS